VKPPPRYASDTATSILSKSIASKVTIIDPLFSGS